MRLQLGVLKVMKLIDKDILIRVAIDKMIRGEFECVVLKRKHLRMCCAIGELL